MDSVFNYVEKGNTNTAIIRANKTGPVKLRIKTYSPQYVTVTFSGAQGNSARKLCYNDRWTEFNGTITTSKDNEVNITGAPNLMYIDGMKDVYPSVLNLDNATKLVEVDCRNSPHLRSLSLASNRLLQKVDVSGCNNLGETNTTLDLSTAVNLKSLNIAGTKIIELKLPASGSALKELNCSNTKMTTFILNGQAVLPSVNLSNCSDLATVSISNCNSLLSVDLSNSILTSFRAYSNAKLEEINVSNTPRLSVFDISLCPGLKRVHMRYLTNPDLTECTLSNCDMIEEVDITGSIYITNIRVGSNRQYKALKVLKASGSGIIGITKGTDTPATSMNLSGYSMTGINVSNCPNITDIVGINIEGPINEAFYNCGELGRISGKIKVVGSANSAFKGCKSLTNLPTGDNFDVRGAVDCNSMFEGCTSLTKDIFLDVLPKLESAETIYKMWYGCSNIVVDNGDITANTFSKWYNIKNWYWPFTGVKFTSPINMSNMTGMLDNCTRLDTIREMFPSITGTLPADLFKNCTRLTSLWGAFAQTPINDVYYGLTAPPSANLLSTCTNVTDVTDMFSNNVNMAGSIPAALLANCEELQKSTGLFRNCEKLTGDIPATFFANNTELTNADYTFSGCKKLTGSIPATLLANNTKLQSVKGLFSGCSGLSGSIPGNLFANNKQLSSVAEIFNGCNGLGGVAGQTQEIPAELFAGLAQLLDASNAFRDCSKLLFTLSTRIFKDCTALVNISGVFAGCLGLTGNIDPAFFSCTRNNVTVPMAIQKASEVFSGCQGLSGNIPSNMFDNFTAVEDLSSFFYKCTNLTGEIPDQLLYNCPNLVKAASMFTQCSGLGKVVVDADTPFISADFFSQNPILEDVSGIFSQCAKFKGIIPDTMFTNNTRLKNVNSLLYGTVNVSGNLTDNLFRNNQLLEDVGMAFRNCNNITGIDEYLFQSSRHTKLKNFAYTFQGCIKMAGTVPALWDMYPQADGNKCFADLDSTKITNYASIPGSWM